MAIKEVESNGTKSFEVFVSIRSKLNPKLRLQKKRLHIATLREAQKLERELLTELCVKLGKLEGSGLPWPDLLEKYELAHRRDSPLVKKKLLSTIWDTIGILQRFTKSWEKKFCNEITSYDVRKLLQAMIDQGYSHSRQKAVRSSINTIFKWGIEDGSIVGIRTSPAADIQLGKSHDEKPPQVLSMTEIHQLLEEARKMDHEWHPIWFMALHTGMRSGELQALEWKHIDFENDMITCEASYNHRLKRVKSTKAGYWRKIPISPELKSMLYELRAKNVENSVNVLPRIQMWHRGEASKVLRNFCVGIGVTSVCFHALRACFATHLLNAGVTSPVVKKICGWTDEKVMTRYIRLAGIDVRGATEALNFVKPQLAEAKVANLNDFRSGQKYVPRRSE